MLEKALESIIEMDKLIPVAEENVVAETNVFNAEWPKKLEATFLFVQKLLLCISDIGELPSKLLTLISKLITNQIYRKKFIAKVQFMRSFSKKLG